MEFAPRVYQFIERYQAMLDDYWKERGYIQPTPTVTTKFGTKYVRIFKRKYGQESIACFIDMRNGDILMAATYKAPAKHARGNIFSDQCGMEAMDEFGAKRLR
jgi:hypothetical protein